MSENGSLWLIVVAFSALIIAGAVLWLVVIVKHFLERGIKTFDQVDLLLAKKNEEIGMLVRSVTLVTEQVESVVSDISPVVKVFKKVAVTADDLSDKGVKAFLSLNNIVSRLFIGMLQGSKKEKK